MGSEIAIYGAKSVALGVYKAVSTLYPSRHFLGFIVSSLEGNPCHLAGEKVWELRELRDRLPEEERKQLKVLIGTPEDLHGEITKLLQVNGFTDYFCIDSGKEQELMEAYYKKLGVFPSLHALPVGDVSADMQVYQAKFHRDRVLSGQRDMPGWIRPMQAGASLADIRVADLADDTGDNISGKNVNYCELTVLYWAWKNRMGASGNEGKNVVGRTGDSRYYGLFHYRRILDISEEDVKRIRKNDVDVVLPFPTLHEPDIREHHERYINDQDWDAMVQALEELHPDYREPFHRFLLQQYFYNYNLVVAKEKVLADYCAWLFPVLERTEELSRPKGRDRADRYIGYIAESLLTVYFLYHQKDLKVYHAGRLMLT